MLSTHTHICLCLLAICMFFRKCLFRSFAHFSTGLLLLLLLSCIRHLPILEVKPLSVTSLAYISSQSVGCLFVLFMVSFLVQKLVSLMRFHLFLFLLPWETDLRKHWYNLCQRMFCLCSPLGILWCHIFCLSL